MLKLGLAMCGSFCTHKRAVSVLSALAASGGFSITPILSRAAAFTDTRFGTAESLRGAVSAICGRAPVVDIVGAEPLGPAIPQDVLVICPCTGCTLSKLAHAVTDTSVTMACKAHLRADRPVVIALASNDAMAGNLSNIGELLCRKNIYFVPMRQDDVEHKPHSLVADFDRVPDAITAALEGRQLRPLFL